MLDGVVGYGAGGTDLGAIPSTALSRVEVLRDGAAAQYGSDAIVERKTPSGAPGDLAFSDELPKTQLSNTLCGIRYPTATPFGLFGRFAYLRLTVDIAR